MEKQFSSLDYNHIFPENTPTKFTIPLPTPITVSENTKIKIEHYYTYPSFYNISKNEYYIDVFKNNNYKKTVTIEEGYYPDLKSIVSNIHNALQQIGAHSCTLVHDHHGNCIIIDSDEEFVSMKLSPAFRSLGFHSVLSEMRIKGYPNDIPKFNYQNLSLFCNLSNETLGDGFFLLQKSICKLKPELLGTSIDKIDFWYNNNPSSNLGETVVKIKYE